MQVTPGPRADVWALLRQVNLTRSGGSFDALADPASTDALASLLADRVQPLGPDLLVVWEGLNSTVLGYAVGVRLSVPVLVLSDDEGLVRAATPARGGTRAALVAPLTPDDSIARMAASYLESQGITLITTAMLLARSENGAVAGPGDTIALAERPRDMTAPDDLTRSHSDQSDSTQLWPTSRQDRR